MFYSAKTGFFYAPEDRVAHEEKGTWPEDAKEVPDDLYAAVITYKPIDKRIVPGPDGLPMLVDRPKATLEQVWEWIKAERDRRTEYGGCLVDGRWYDTDSRSALRYKLLADQAAMAGATDDAVVRAGWRPMDVELKGEVDMTYGLLKRIMAAGIAAAMDVDDATEKHKAAMLASADPSAYDYSGGWPDAYADEAVQ